MPKKRTSNFKSLQGPSTPPNPKLPTSTDNASVNDRLNSLRLIPTPESEARKRELAEFAGQRSVPPQLRGILGVPETAPPRARGNVRATPRFRTPGPAPPKSWTQAPGGRTGWVGLVAKGGGRRRGRREVGERGRPGEVGRFARMAGFEGGEEGKGGVGSLTHCALKTVAEQWEMLDPEDYGEALAGFPLSLRLRLLSYLACYGPAIGIEAFKALTQGTEPVIYLDLAGLIGHSTLRLPKLTKLFRPQEARVQEAGSGVAESWEQEEAFETHLSATPSLSRFSSLTHLSLSHPPPTILWKDLLSFTKHTPQLTHLSLAFWPRPTLTPNLATTTVSSQHSPDVRAGGSHFYSGMDQDMSEPASLLRQLSNNLLRLQWLDLEGCTEWIPALASLAAPTDPMNSISETDAWSTSSPVVMQVFTDTWKNLSYMHVAQGWLPTYAGIDALPKQQGISSDRELVRELLAKLPFSVAETHDQLDREKRRAQVWLEAEARVLSAGRRINNIRGARSSKRVVMDHGWAQKTR